MKIRTVLFALFFVLAACDAPQQAPPEPKAQEGRAETQNIRNTDAVGYGGSAIADKVDATLDASEQRNRQLEEAEREGSE